MAAERQRGRDLRAVADATRGEHGHRRDLLDHLRPQDHGADVAAVTTAFAALRDHDVDARIGVLARLVRRAAQRRDLATLRVDVLDHVGGRRPQRVGDELHLRMCERDLHLRRGGRLGPAEQLERVVVAFGRRHAVVVEELAGEVEMRLRHHLLQHLREVLGGHVGVHALVLVRDHDVDAVRPVADVLVDPVELDLELLGAEAHRAQDAEAAGLAHRHHNVTAVGEREDRELDAELVADRGTHGRGS